MLIHELPPVWLEVLVRFPANGELSHYPPLFSLTSPLTTFTTGTWSTVSPVPAGEEILPHHLLCSSILPLSHPRALVSPAKKQFFKSGTPSLLQAARQKSLSSLAQPPPKYLYSVSPFQLYMRNNSSLTCQWVVVGYWYWLQNCYHQHRCS